MEAEQHPYRETLFRETILRGSSQSRLAEMSGDCGSGGCISCIARAEAIHGAEQKNRPDRPPRGQSPDAPVQGGSNMAKTTHAKVVIVGSGPAGYTAAIYAARAMLKPILIQGVQPGGQLMITTDVENYPGFADVIRGPWLMEQMQAQSEHVGTRIVTDHVVKVELAQRPFKLICDS